MLEIVFFELGVGLAFLWSGAVSLGCAGTRIEQQVPEQERVRRERPGRLRAPQAQDPAQIIIVRKDVMLSGRFG